MKREEKILCINIHCTCTTIANANYVGLGVEYSPA